MGCGPSVEGVEKRQQPSPAELDTPACHERFRKYLENADGALHDDHDFSAPLTEAEKAQLQKMEDEWSIHSRGDACPEEPSTATLQSREHSKVATAKSEHGINGDPEQFVPTPESQSDIEKSCTHVRAWLEYNEALVNMANEKSTNLSSADSSLVDSSPGLGPQRHPPNRLVGGSGAYAIDVSSPDNAGFGDSCTGIGKINSSGGLLSASDRHAMASPRSPGSAYSGFGASGATDMSATVFALDHGRVMRPAGGGGGGGSSSTPRHIMATPGTPFLGGPSAPRMPLRADVLASHLRRLKALERGEVPAATSPVRQSSGAKAASNTSPGLTSSAVVMSPFAPHRSSTSPLPPPPLLPEQA